MSRLANHCSKCGAHYRSIHHMEECEEKKDTSYGCSACDYEGTRNGCFHCGAFN